MAIIEKGAPEEGLRGKIGGLVYSRQGDRTIVRSAPIYPKSAKKNPVKKKQMSMFSLIRKYCAAHYKVFQYTFDREGPKTPANFYYQHNHAPLKRAFAELYERYQAGEDVLTVTEMNQAVNRYAQAHPDEIFLAHKQGYQPVYFTGTWPTAITLLPEKPGTLPEIIIRINEQ